MTRSSMPISRKSTIRKNAVRLSRRYRVTSERMRSPRRILTGAMRGG
jgi:hypothetical protein